MWCVSRFQRALLGGTPDLKHRALCPAPAGVPMPGSHADCLCMSPVSLLCPRHSCPASKLSFSPHTTPPSTTESGITKIHDSREKGRRKTPQDGPLESHWVAFPEPPTREGQVPELGANSLRPGLPRGGFQAFHFPPWLHLKRAFFRLSISSCPLPVERWGPVIILAQTFGVFGNTSLSET